jgi:tetratricopeptide (TPR) repeat protein
MVSHLLGTSEIDLELQSLILAKTEGIPFFIEEFVKSLEGLQVIKREDSKARLLGDPQSLAIPSTIQDMIMARVDRLPDQAKAVLQAGSVIEREFPHDLIRKVTGFPEAELLSHLSAIKDAELLYERGIYPQTSYIFRHALTREVVYNSVLARRRREPHGQIGVAIEGLHKDDLADHYEVLSEHFFQSEDYPKAADYSKRAARKAEKSASFPDAIAHARKRVLCLEKSRGLGEPGKELIDARTVLGLYLAQVNRVRDAKEAVEPVAQVARERGYWRRLGQIQSVMGYCYAFAEEDFPKATKALEEALEIAEREKDFVTLVLASYWLGCLHGSDCNFEEAKKWIQKALDINVAVRNLWGIAAMKASLAYACYWYPGRVEPFMELSSEALRIAQESGDPYSRGMAHSVYGHSCYAKRRLEDAEIHLLEGRDLCERIGLQAFASLACGCLGMTYFEMKDYQKSRECYDHTRRLNNRAPMFPSWARWAEVGIALCGVILGERDVSLEPLRAIPEKNRVRVAEGSICRFLGEISLHLGGSHITEAEHWIRKAVEADDRNGMRFHLGTDHAVYSDFFRRRGDRIKAQEQLGKAIDILRECGADGWVEKYEKELAAFG